MTQFSVEKIIADERLRPSDGILKAEALGLLSDANVLAEQIVQEARNQAEDILSRARAEASALEQSAEARVVERAAELLGGLEEASETVAERVGGIVVDLVIGLFDKLLVQTTSRKRIEASLKRLQREAPTKLMEAVLRVHPEDAALLPEVEWEVRHDDAITRGACRLEASSGEWHADFEAAVASVRNAFYDAVERSMGGDEMDEDSESDGDDRAEE